MSGRPDISHDLTVAQRRVQRRTRIRDAMRLLPFLGLALFLLPDLVLSGGPAAQGATAPWLVYLFVAWIVLLLISVCLTRLHLADEDVPTNRTDT